MSFLNSSKFRTTNSQRYMERTIPFTDFCVSSTCTAKAPMKVSLVQANWENASTTTATERVALQVRVTAARRLVAQKIR